MVRFSSGTQVAIAIRVVRGNFIQPFLNEDFRFFCGDAQPPHFADQVFTPTIDVSPCHRKNSSQYSHGNSVSEARNLEKVPG
jgi:hypothetical protein